MQVCMIEAAVMSATVFSAALCSDRNGAGLQRCITKRKAALVLCYAQQSNHNALLLSHKIML